MSRNIVRVNKTQNYTVMSNTHLKDDRLSWKAKGIHSYILSLPDDWKVILEHLKTVSTDGRDSTTAGIKELYKYRYWQKYPVYQDGKIVEWITEVYEEPFPENEKIKSIIYKENIKVINYENETSEEIDLLTGNPLVVDNTDVDLLTGNLQVGILEVDNPTLLNTNNTNNLSFTNHSFNQLENKDNDNDDENKKEEENERMNEDKEKLEEILEKAQVDLFVDSFVKPKGIKRAIESLWYRTKPLETNNMKIPVDKLKDDLSDLTSSDIEIGLQIYSEQSRHQRISNRTTYLGVCIYNAMFDKDLKIHNDLRVDGII